MFLTQRGICPSFCVRMILQILLYIFDGDPGVLLFFPSLLPFQRRSDSCQMQLRSFWIWGQTYAFAVADFFVTKARAFLQASWFVFLYSWFFRSEEELLRQSGTRDKWQQARLYKEHWRVKSAAKHVLNSSFYFFDPTQFSFLWHKQYTSCYNAWTPLKCIKM